AVAECTPESPARIRGFTPPLAATRGLTSSGSPPGAVMLNLWGSSPLDRRELLRVGGLALGGLSLSTLLAKPAAANPKPKSFGKAKNCIILYLSGAPSQLDTFDPKPDAPDDIRGEFGTIQTKLPGVRFSELLPLAAS